MRARAECVGVELRFSSTPFPEEKLKEIERREALPMLWVNVMDAESHSLSVVDQIPQYEKVRVSLIPWAQSHGMMRVGNVYFAGEEVQDLTWEV